MYQNAENLPTGINEKQYDLDFMENLIFFINKRWGKWIHKQKF